MRTTLLIGIIALLTLSAAGPATRPSALAGGSVPIGTLGQPLGAAVTIEGQAPPAPQEVRKNNSVRVLIVDTVNGEKLPHPIGITVTNIERAPETGRCVLRGYESGRMIGNPPALEEWARKEGKEFTVPQAVWQWSSYFVALSVESPKDLRMLPPKE